MGFEAWATVVILTLWLSLFVYLLAGLRDEEGVSNPSVRPERNEGIVFRALAAAKTVGVTIVSVVDDALARFTAFVKDVIAQLTVAKDTNGTQTGKIAELQAALDKALSDDASDKAAISALQAEISSLQDSVAAQIDAALDALSKDPNAAAEAPVEVPAEAPVVDAPVAEEPPVAGDQTSGEPVA